MNIFLQKAIAVCNIFSHLWKNRVVVSSPLGCVRLFMDRTPASYEAELRFGNQTFVSRKQDMNAVKEVLVDGAYDYMNAYLRDLPHQPVVVDCGANIGSFSLRVLKERADAKVVSVEAATDTYSILKKNSEQSASDWKVAHAALWKSDGELALRREGSSERNSVQEAGQDDIETIPACTLTTIKKKFGITRIDLLKMDIEGAETVVIPASQDEINADRMIIEIHKNHSDPTECCSILAKKYPYALVAPEHLTDRLHPNIVYYLTLDVVEIPGMVAVDMMNHLRNVYESKDWS